MCVSDDRHGMKMDETCEKSKVLALPAEISLGISHIFFGMGQHHRLHVEHIMWNNMLEIS